MDLSEWEAGEWTCYDGEVNCGVGGMVLGIGWTVRLIGKVGKYGSTLSPYKVESKFTPSGGSNPSIGDVSSIGCIWLARVAPFARPTD